MVHLIVFAIFALLASVSLAQETGQQSSDEISKQELAKLQGQWALDTLDGRKFVYTFKGNEYSINDSDLKTKFVIDATKEPKSITRVGVDGESSRGIIKIDGDTLVICSARGGGERPTEFKSKAGVWTLLTWKRVVN